MDKRDFYYDLPKELIAQTPLADRAASRLLTLNRRTGDIVHGQFSDIVNILRPNDCIVINNTKVIPARLVGQRTNGGGSVEILLLNNRGGDIWEVLVKPGKWGRAGAVLHFSDMLSCEITDVLPDGNRLVRFSYDGIFEEILDTLGEMPLPPYITERLTDAGRHQTVYAKESGSAAAPTAGLHFTDDILAALRDKGVAIAHVTLHVGLGTFRPVKTEKIEDHTMHSEYYALEAAQADIINAAGAKGGRVIAVGTTSVRTLESCAADNGTVAPGSGYTGIFIYPGYRFKAVDGLITNFHLPESTLIMLVCAFSSRPFIMHAYQEAIRERYRFFSFGDAMLLVNS